MAYAEIHIVPEDFEKFKAGEFVKAREKGVAIAGDLEEFETRPASFNDSEVRLADTD